ncbi:hypothetical protein HYH03_016401 [Edaphochlamys debaryana]|uniref:Uncharacterized protein n=1 Tax=Edaphochlamys debaryana TaxID=47281 RepID=A0A835XRQ6_9CHLO|nr:hypothetical protein HYH03_016401 [Edaphochlamys debaryana]|eukprot:KAG2484834.1 hypothetical protein HYH03_016401 [Edaphochlamys debaryana]
MSAEVANDIANSGGKWASCPSAILARLQARVDIEATGDMKTFLTDKVVVYLWPRSVRYAIDAACAYLPGVEAADSLFGSSYWSAELNCRGIGVEGTETIRRGTCGMSIAGGSADTQLLQDIIRGLGRNLGLLEMQSKSASPYRQARADLTSGVTAANAAGFLCYNAPQQWQLGWGDLPSGDLSVLLDVRSLDGNLMARELPAWGSSLAGTVLRINVSGSEFSSGVTFKVFWVVFRARMAPESVSPLFSRQTRYAEEVALYQMSGAQKQTVAEITDPFYWGAANDEYADVSAVVADSATPLLLKVWFDRNMDVSEDGMAATVRFCIVAREAATADECVANAATSSKDPPPPGSPTSPSPRAMLTAPTQVGPQNRRPSRPPPSPRPPPSRKPPPRRRIRQALERGH